MGLAANLQNAIEAVCPTIGVSLGSKNDKSTWRIDFAESATAEQQQAAEHVVLQYEYAEDIPVAVTMRQARLALLQSGLLPNINDLIASMPGEGGEAARIEWDYSNIVERGRPVVEAIAAELQLSGEQVDNLFILAATL